MNKRFEIRWRGRNAISSKYFPLLLKKTESGRSEKKKKLNGLEKENWTVMRNESRRSKKKFYIDVGVGYW